MSLPVVYAVVGGSVVCLVMVGWWLFQQAWPTYEEKYLQSTERSLESLLLSMPLVHMVYLCILSLIGIFSLFLWLSGSITIALFFAIPCFFGPNIILWWLKKRRAFKFVVQLVDCLDNMSNSMKAGFSLPQAFEQIVKEMPSPISQEFMILTREMRLGLPMDDALKNMLKRMPGEDLDLVVTAIMISRELGGNLTEVFESISITIRERWRIEGKIKALTSQGKMQGLVVSLIPAAMAAVLNLINPEFIRPLFTTGIGWCLIALIVVMELLGYYVIKKIVTIEV